MMAPKVRARFILIASLALGIAAAFGPVGHSTPVHALADGGCWGGIVNTCNNG